MAVNLNTNFIKKEELRETWIWFKVLDKFGRICRSLNSNPKGTKKSWHHHKTVKFLFFGGQLGLIGFSTRSFFQKKNQFYQTLISSFSWFLLLSLSICSLRKYILCFKKANLIIEKWNKSSIYKEKSLVRLTRGLQKFSLQKV